MTKFRELLQRVPEYKVPGERRGILLDLNESRWGCSERVLDALRNMTREDVGMYPAERRLVKLIAEHHGLPEEYVLLTNGADEAIRCTLEACLDPQDEMIVADPTFPVFEIIGNLCGAEVRKVPYGSDLRFPSEEIVRAISERTKVVVVVNPDSPTGAWIDREEFLRILNAAESSFVVLDETYHHFAEESFSSLVEAHPNLMVIHSFSKAFGMAGLRLGYILSRAENLRVIRRARLPFSVNSAAVSAGCAAMEDISHVRRVVEEMKHEKAYLKSRLEEIGFSVRDTRTNFILVRVPEPEYISRALRASGICVKPLHSIPQLRKFLRVAVGRREENDMFIDAMQWVLPEAVIFDMDGVLVDVSESYIQCIKRTAESFLGEEVPVEAIEEYKLRGYNSDWDLTHALLTSKGLKVELDDVVDRFQRIFREDALIERERCLISSETLTRLGEKYRLGVVTGRPRDEAQYSMQKFGLDRFFDVVVAMEDMGDRQKPDPHGILMALKEMGVERAAYVGDNVDDMRCARAANAMAVGVAYSPRSGEHLRSHGADVIVHDVNDVVEVLM